MKTPGELGEAHVLSIARRNPRLAGAFLFCFGVLLMGGNVGLFYFMGLFVSMLFIVGFPASAMGLWILLTGRINQTDGSRTPLWWTVGALLLTGAGIVVGIYLSERLAP